MRMFPEEFDRIHPYGVAGNHVALAVDDSRKCWTFSIEEYNPATTEWNEVEWGLDTTEEAIAWIKANYGWREAARIKQLIRDPQP